MLFALLLGATTPQAHSDLAQLELKTHIVSLSVLRQGVALVVREGRVEPGSHQYKLDFLPDALNGSFWYGSPEGVQVGDVKTKLRFVNDNREVASLEDVLANNVGREVDFFAYTYLPSGTVQNEYKGKLTDYNASRNTCSFLLSDGFLFQLGVNQISRIDTKGLILSSKTKRPVQEIDFDSTSDKAGAVDFATLEPQATWTGSYLVDLNDPYVASIVSKAQLAVAGLTLDDADVQVVSGNPVLREIGKYDLASGIGGLAAFMNGDQSSFFQYRLSNRDPYDFLGMPQNPSGVALDSELGANLNIRRDYNGFGRGGGGGGGAYEAQSFNSAPAQTTGTEKVEDLYGFPLGKVAMQPGDRLSRVMFRVQSPYQRLYKWTVGRANPYGQANGVPDQSDVVEKIIKIKNDSKMPWPTGSAMLVEKHVPLGQVDMDFVPIGKFAELRLGEVSDIPTRSKVNELSRASVVVRGANMTLVSSQTTLSVENTRSEPIEMEIVYELTGTIDDPGGAQVESISARGNAYNPENLLTWTFTLKPGESKQFVVKFKANS